MNETPNLDYDNLIEIGKNKSLIELYYNIISILPRKKCRTIQFVDFRPSTGTSKIIRELSRICANQFNHKVLIIELIQSPDGQLNFFAEKLISIDSREHIRDISDLKIYDVEDTNISVARLLNQTSNPVDIEQSNEIKLFLEESSKKFDFILIDYKFYNNPISYPFVSEMIDGVILVVEAEKIRWQTVQVQRNFFESKGLVILGVILNKRKYPIPKFIYDRL